MVSSWSFVWLSAASVVLATAQRSSEYTQNFCPNVTVIQDINTSAYLGAWFEVRRYPARFEQAASCVSTHYSLKEDGNITILARMFNTTTNKYVTMEGVLRKGNPDSTEAKMLASFTTSQAEGDYWVLGTDYTSYAIVWWCRENTDNDYSLYLWIISRTKKLSADAELAVKKILTENGLSFDKTFIATNQENCPTENGDN